MQCSGLPPYPPTYSTHTSRAPCPAHVHAVYCCCCTGHGHIATATTVCCTATATTTTTTHTRTPGRSCLPPPPRQVHCRQLQSHSPFRVHGRWCYTCGLLRPSLPPSQWCVPARSQQASSATGLSAPPSLAVGHASEASRWPPPSQGGRPGDSRLPPLARLGCYLPDAHGLGRRGAGGLRLGPRPGGGGGSGAGWGSCGSCCCWGCCRGLGLGLPPALGLLGAPLLVVALLVLLLALGQHHVVHVQLQYNGRPARGGGTGGTAVQGHAATTGVACFWQRGWCVCCGQRVPVGLRATHRCTRAPPEWPHTTTTTTTPTCFPCCVARGICTLSCPPPPRYAERKLSRRTCCSSAYVLWPSRLDSAYA